MTEVYLSRDVILRLIPSTLEWAALILLADVFFRRARPKWVYALSVALLLALNWLTLPYTMSGTALRYACCIVLMLLWQLIIFRARVFQGLFVALLGLTYFMAVDYAILSVVAARIALEDLLSDVVVGCWTIYSIKLIELVVIVIIYILRREYFRRRTPDTVGWITAVLFLAPVFGLCLYLSGTFWNDPGALGHFMIPAACMLIIELGAVCMLYFSGQKQEAIHDSAVLRQNLKLEQEHIAALTRSYTRQRAQTHDFKNQLAVLRSMAEQGAPQEEFAAYLNSVLAADVPGVLYINTHRTAADITLSQKVPLARDKGIDFQFQLDDLSGFPMADDALVVVLTNLIDNAMEACEKIPDSKGRHIWLKMKMTSRFGILNIENTTAGPVAVRGGTVHTTKADPLSHGYGLKNVAAMISQSGGMYFIEYRKEDGVFRFCASIPRTAEKQ